MKALLDLVRRHRSGEPVGIYSVCSAHPLVLRAALETALTADACALIEATANQVNQDGGYTGLRPAAFRDQLWRIAAEVGLPRERLLLGGDHLGPTCWQALPAEDALARAGIMVGEYVQAGFRKIHLDCSMACGDDPRALGDELIAARTAALCARAEAAWQATGGEPPVYVIGSEVPVPGGAHESLHELAVTERAAALATVDAHRTAFLRAGLGTAWDRVIGLVVQPGVEFDNEHVVDYVSSKTALLRTALDAVPQLVFEAHSTDYQTTGSLAALVRDHFAILKVGPGVTFALREAIWALDRIELEWLGERHSSGARTTVLAAMRAEPAHWSKYYSGTGRSLELQLEYGLSDRIRYYWAERSVAAAVERLYASLDARPPPDALVSQYLPSALRALRSSAARPRTRDLVIAHVREVLAGYARACEPTSGNMP
jgi:D-tagatose-1,6-bisphosphate aldolase subunit GatZ/KbaZ